jgi:hypothetical protein
MSEGTRVNINDGQELVFSDINKIAPRMEKHLFERVLYELLQRTANAFFGDSFKVIYSTSTSAQIKAGVGFINNTGVDGWESKQQPLYNDADLTINFATPNPTNPRIDIVVVKASLVDGNTESRKYKNASTDVVTNEDFVTSKDWYFDYQIVEGTPDPSPVAPAVPTGYIRIASCLVNATTGFSGQTDITDERAELPLAGPSSVTGSLDYDKVVGDVAKFGVTHGTLKAALDAAVDGDKILVLQDETINTGEVPVVDNQNIEIVFKRGVTFTKGTAAIGLQIDDSDCKVVNGRFKDFSSGGDVAVVNSAGSDRTMLRDLRFNNCDTNFSNLGSKFSETGTIEE